MFNRDPADNNETLLNQMSTAIRHRGPDDSQYIVRDGLCVAFRRLSIIDLNTGDQPFTSEDGRYTAVFNGEIYNYRDLRAPLMEEGVEFRTNSEIEVIVELYRKYGDEFITRLRGMFAILIYELVGPLLTKMALQAAGEIHPMEDAVKNRRQINLEKVNAEKK